MRAGDLRHPIMIQMATMTRDSAGQSVRTWTSGKNTQAAIWPLRGSEYFASQQLQAGVTHKIRIRHQTLANSTAIDPKHRIKFGSRYFSINSIINTDERNIMLDMMCTEDVQ